MVQYSATRELVRERLNEILDSHGTVETHEAVATIIAGLTEANRDALVSEVIHLFVTRELAALVRDRRLHVYNGGAATDDALAGRAKKIASRVFENVGGSTRKRVTDLTRPDCLEAIRAREHQIAGHQPWLRFLRSCAETLPNDEITVGQYFSENQFSALWWACFAP